MSPFSYVNSTGDRQIKKWSQNKEALKVDPETAFIDKHIAHLCFWWITIPSSDLWGQNFMALCPHAHFLTTHLNPWLLNILTWTGLSYWETDNKIGLDMQEIDREGEREKVGRILRMQRLLCKESLKEG